MAVNPEAGEVGILIIIKNKRIERVEPAQGTEGKVRKLEPQEKDALFSRYRQTKYGLRSVEEIYEHDTEGPNTCVMYIDGFEIIIPCS